MGSARRLVGPNRSTATGGGTGAGGNLVWVAFVWKRKAG